MAVSSIPDERYSRKGGTGGAQEGYELWTHGKRRARLHANGALEFYPSDTTPDATTEVGTGVLFFRNDGSGKSQACLRFPSGAVQILCTEP